MMKQVKRYLGRTVRASWRDTFLLLREFRHPLIAFVILFLVGGTAYFILAQGSDTPIDEWVESVYLMLNLIFLQSFGDFPHAWYLQVFYFFMPLVGLAIVAQGLAEFGIMLFNRKARSKEWEMAVASTFSDHIVLVGLGHLGYRVVQKLHELGEDVVVIESNPKLELVKTIRALGVPVIEDDGSRDDSLRAAGVSKAKTIILCTQNDSLNLQIALKARGIQPIIDVIIRIFDNEFAEALQKQFGFKALSATGMAAPIFAALAANIDMTPSVNINGEPNSLAKIVISERSDLAMLEIGQVEDQNNISVVMLIHNGETDIHPSSKLVIQVGDTLALFGNPDQINKMILLNNHHQ